MEKLIVTGGEQYLPFARARIQAMRATGMQWASQRFEMGDATVVVRLEGALDYIELSGGGCTLSMDSGVVDLLSINTNLPEAYEPGTLHRSEAVSDYLGAYTEPGKPAGNLRNPAAGSSGQVAGTVRYASGFKGSVPAQDAPAPSFTGKRALPGEGEAPADPVLLAKKQIALAFPPSMLTGRARFYLQSLYGLPMYDYAFNDEGEPTAVRKANLVLSSDGQGPVLPTFDRLGTVTLTVDSGIFLDPATGKHYLIQPVPSAAGTHIYPLKSSACGEAMRKLLIGKEPKPGDTLTAEDLHHIEAYILSQSLPDSTKLMKAGSSATGSSSFSFGYGWKWNWDGTQADRIVWDGTAAQDSRHATYSTSHWRFALRFEDGAFSSSCTTVEGSTSWGLPISFFNVAYPNFGMARLQKFLDYPAYLFNFDAPVYCFYRKNELQVVRVKCDQVTAEEEWEYTPFFFQDPNNWKKGGTFAKTCMTLGLGSGSSTHVDGGPPFFNIAFSINGREYGPMPWGRMQSGDYDSVGGKTLTGAEDDSLAGPYFLAAHEATNLFTGPADMSNFPTSIGNPAVVATSGAGVYYSGIFQQASYQREASDVTDTDEVWGFIVIPFNDAEAVYIRTHHVELETHTLVYRATHEDYPFVSRSFGPGVPHVQAFFAIAQGPGGDVNSSDYTVRKPKSADSDLHCAAGTVAAEDYPMSPSFWDTEDPFVADTFATVASTHPTKPVVLARTKISPVNTGQDPENPAIVGWA